MGNYFIYNLQIIHARTIEKQIHKKKRNASIQSVSIIGQEGDGKKKEIDEVERNREKGGRERGKWKKGGMVDAIRRLRERKEGQEVGEGRERDERWRMKEREKERKEKGMDERERRDRGGEQKGGMEDERG